MWEQTNTSLNEGSLALERLPITADQFETGDDGAFAAQIADAVVMGGLRDPASGAVVSLVVAVDPDGQTAAPAITTLVYFAATRDTIEDLARRYAAIAGNPVSGASDYVAAGEFDFVIRVVDGATAGDNLVHVYVAPTTNEQEALATSLVAQQAVLALLAG